MEFWKNIIEFFITNGALPLVVSAVAMLLFVVMYLFRLNRISDFPAFKFILLWLVIAVPQLIAIQVSEQYKQRLPIHKVELSNSICQQSRFSQKTNQHGCYLKGRLISEEKDHYIFSIDGQKIKIRKCEVIKILNRKFEDYRSNFEKLFTGVGEDK